jgi:hypothetical protein
MGHCNYNKRVAVPAVYQAVGEASQKHAAQTAREICAGFGILDDTANGLIHDIQKLETQARLLDLIPGKSIIEFSPSFE